MATKQTRHCDIFPEKTRGVRSYRFRIERQEPDGTWSDAVPAKTLDMSPNGLHRARSFLARATLPASADAAAVKADVGEKIKVTEPAPDIEGQQFIDGCEPEAK